MSRREFLENVRQARNLLVHPRAAADAGLDPASLGDQIQRADIWLTPASIEGFDPNDFNELDPAKREQLADAVNEFRSVAARVAPAVQATRQQYLQAATALVRVIDMLRAYLASPEEERKIRQALRTVPLPAAVVNWDYELGEDAAGQPALWVTLFTDEPDANYPYGRMVSDLNLQIRRALSGLGVNRWPYLKLETAAEHMAK